MAEKVSRPTDGPGRCSLGCNEAGRCDDVGADVWAAHGFSPEATDVEYVGRGPVMCYATTETWARASDVMSPPTDGR